MTQITVYEKPTCSTCRRVVSLLTERGRVPRQINYLENPLTRDELADLLRRGGLQPREMVRVNEPGAQELLAHEQETILQILAERPELLQRPLVVRGDRVVLARPPERVLELLD